jgi:hypothetical protein
LLLVLRMGRWEVERSNMVLLMRVIGRIRRRREARSGIALERWNGGGGSGGRERSGGSALRRTGSTVRFKFRLECTWTSSRP